MAIQGPRSYIFNRRPASILGHLIGWKYKKSPFWDWTGVLLIHNCSTTSLRKPHLAQECMLPFPALKPEILVCKVTRCLCLVAAVKCLSAVINYVNLTILRYVSSIPMDSFLSIFWPVLYGWFQYTSQYNIGYRFIFLFLPLAFRVLSRINIFR